MSDPLPVGTLLGGTFRTFGRTLPRALALSAVAWSPAIAWLAARGSAGAGPAVAIGVGCEIVAWAVVTPGALAAMRGGRLGLGASVAAGLRALPRAAASLLVAYALLVGAVVGAWYLFHALDMELGYGIPAAMAGLGLPLGCMLLAAELYGRWMVVVPLAVDRGEGVREAGRLTLPYRTALHGVLLVIGVIWGVATVCTLVAAANAPGKLTAGHATVAVIYAWIPISLLRGAMATASYVAIADRTVPLAQVFE